MSWTAGYERPGIAVELRPRPSSVFAPANALIGNPPRHGTLEVAYVGPTLLVDAEDVRVVVVRAKAGVVIRPDRSRSFCVHCPEVQKKCKVSNFLIFPRLRDTYAIHLQSISNTVSEIHSKELAIRRRN
jgi:hypothetical protein